MVLESEKEEFLNQISKNKLKLYKTAKVILHNETDVEDAIQEALISAYENYDKLKDKQLFMTWLIRILMNKCFYILKQNKKTVAVEDFYDENNQESKDSEVEILEKNEVIKAVNQLDTILRTTVILYYYDDMPTKNIAKIMKVPEGTVKSRLNKARKELELKLNKEGIKNE